MQFLSTGFICSMKSLNPRGGVPVFCQSCVEQFIMYICIDNVHVLVVLALLY